MSAYKLQQSGAGAIVVAPRWEGKAWHYALTEIAVEELAVAPHPGLFRPGRREGRDPGTMVRYVTWLGNSAMIKAPSMQPYLSAVNNVFKDNGREPMALGDLVGRVRKGLAASQMKLHMLGSA
eukprot:jgi/Tetstr1/423233/TSEL_001351.t1